MRTSDGSRVSRPTRAHIWFTSNAELGGCFFVSRHAKICNTSGSIPSNEDVFRFKISVIHAFPMTCLDAIQYLEEYLPDDLVVGREVVIVQGSPKVSPSAQIKHHVQVLFALDGVFEGNDVGRGPRDGTVEEDFAGAELHDLGGEHGLRDALHCVLLLELWACVGQDITGTVDGAPASLTEEVGEHEAVYEYIANVIGCLFGVHGSELDGGC